jgi:hypothetical protein
MYRQEILRGDVAMTYESEGILFVWFGGMYIDVYNETQYLDGVMVGGKVWTPGDQCLNITDSMTNLPGIEWKDSQAFIVECEEWMSA